MKYERRKQGYVVPVGTGTCRKVAIIGKSSAGFGCAELLVQKGYKVTIFESKPAPAGKLTACEISDFESARDVWAGRQEEFERVGVKFVLNNDIGNDRTIDNFFEEGFDAVFIDMGHESNMKMKDTPGTNLSGVYKAADFLMRANAEPNRLLESKREPLEIGRRFVVIDDGDTTPDCLRTALKLGSADVICLCPHSGSETSVEREGQEMERVEGAKYRFFTQPVRFIAGADGKLAAVECVEMRPGEPNAQGRRNLIPVDGSNFSVAADMAILGHIAPDIEKYMMDKPSGTTLREGVFTSGDYAEDKDAGPVAAAKESGRKTAVAIHKYLKNKK